MLKFDHWHIEPSSICTLKCPRCPRAEVPDTLLNRQLSLDFFKNQIGVNIIRQIRKITFCGNDGDPIYCREFVDICQWIKTVNPEIHLTIVTNGSHKSKEWWQALARVLDHRDEINWSLDGWDQSSNEKYRINSDWDSIAEGIHSFTAANSETYRVWAAIAFKFNQDHLPHMIERAKSIKMDMFQLTKSTKFGSHYPDTYGIEDPLCPDRSDLVSSGSRFERELISLTTKPRPGELLKEIFWSRAQELNKYKKYSGICLIGNKGVFLNSQGEFYPCCWTANRYPHNKKWHDRARTRFNLTDKTFSEIIKDDFWTTEFLQFNSMECQTKCAPERLQDKTHTTEW